jgi:hypothetical protein
VSRPRCFASPTCPARCLRAPACCAAAGWPGELLLLGASHRWSWQPRQRFWLVERSGVLCSEGSARLIPLCVLCVHRALQQRLLLQGAPAHMRCRVRGQQVTVPKSSVAIPSKIRGTLLIACPATAAICGNCEPAAAAIDLQAGKHSCVRTLQHRAGGNFNCT